MNENIKEALKTARETQPSIKAILLGTRRHDPFSDALRTFSPADPDSPHYMRVNPILDWHHADVWSFIRECDVPYCNLYDEGYTPGGGGGTSGISGWGFPAGNLEPLTYTRASLAEFCYPILE